MAEATQAMPQRPAPKEKAKPRAAPQDESSGLAPVDPAVTLILSASPFDLGPPTPSADSSQTSDMDTHSGANLKRAAEELLDQQEARPFPPGSCSRAGPVQARLVGPWRQEAGAAAHDGILASCVPGVPGHGGKWR